MSIICVAKSVDLKFFINMHPNSDRSLPFALLAGLSNIGYVIRESEDS